MSASQPQERRKRAATLDPDCLEPRRLLTGGQGNTFAIVPATIEAQGGSIKVPFQLAPSHFTVPKGRVTLGIDTAVPQNSTAKPTVVAVDDAGGQRVPGVVYSLYDPRTRRNGAASQGLASSAVLATLDLRRLPQGTTPSYSATVASAPDTNGRVLVGFYLPGDADGNGVVEKADLQAIRKILGANSTDSRYSFDADANRDGRIGPIDLRTAQQNEGARVTISPIISANLDPTTDTDAPDRVTSQREVRFTGSASPGASITFTEADNKTGPVTVAADSNGNYALGINLADGSNTFRVTTSDAFGQAISGTLAPVTYRAKVTPGNPIPAGYLQTGPRTTVNGGSGTSTPTITINPGSSTSGS